MRSNLTYHVRWYNSIAEIDREAWDRLAVPLDTPLMEWQWLHALEMSGAIAPQTGWFPRCLTIWQDGRLAAAAPLYIKTHSEGEFVYDFWWARFAKDLNISYYPKLVGMSPVTPSVGYRFMIEPGGRADELLDLMIEAVDRMCVDMDLSGCQLNYVDPQWSPVLSALDFTPWVHQSYIWRNPGYASFENYLQTFKSNQRRNIRRECARMSAEGIDIQALAGDAIPPDLATRMYRCYLNTNAQYGPWAARYLNQDFFQRIFETYRHRLLLIVARRSRSAQAPLALSMLLVKNKRLIGRYWGSSETVKDLHFNMCFYAPIQWAIAHGIESFDPGAGSPHKLARGFQAVANMSWHRFYRPRLKTLFLRFIRDINAVEYATIKEMNEQLPLARKG